MKWEKKRNILLFLILFVIKISSLKTYFFLFIFFFKFDRVTQNFSHTNKIEKMYLLFSCFYYVFGKKKNQWNCGGVMDAMVVMVVRNDMTMSHLYLGVIFPVSICFVSFFILFLLCVATIAKMLRKLKE